MTIMMTMIITIINDDDHYDNDDIFNVKTEENTLPRYRKWTTKYYNQNINLSQKPLLQIKHVLNEMFYYNNKKH